MDIERDEFGHLDYIIDCGGMRLRAAEVLHMLGSLSSRIPFLDIEVSPVCPEGEIRFVDDGEVVGRIYNFNINPFDYPRIVPASQESNG